MDLNGKNLAGWLEAHKGDRGMFPGNGTVDYFARYKSIEEYLNNNVHPQVVPAALYRDGMYLTDHGPKHVEKVIDRVSKLVKSKDCRLSPYDAYMLLVAVQLHDIGNIFGREGHEGKLGEIVRQMGAICGEDTVEKRWFIRIAQAHGGEIDGDRDRIGPLPEVETVLGLPVRIRLLAAILKFADELADERDRAARFLSSTGSLPKESEVYHKYAESLHSVVVDLEGKEIKMQFDVPLESAKRKFGKGDREVYLLDEILKRTFKTHMERLYCSRFLRPDITIDAVSVKIEIYDGEDWLEVIETVGYKLVEKGYPDEPSGGVYTICPELNEWRKIGSLDIGRLDGESLHRSLEVRDGAQNG